MISQPAYAWYHIQYTCDILFTIFRTSYPLFMPTQLFVFLIPHSAYVWHHLHYRWYYIHSITPNHSIYDFTCPSGMTSHPLYQTSNPLYLCHHNLSTDIIPNFVWHHIHFVWHHTHYICDIICTLYNIISTPYVITLLCYDFTASIYEPYPVCRATYALYMWHHSH